MSGREWRAALYLRLSRDDGAGSEESSSIETQRLLLEDYCRTHGFSVHGVYTDDGWSGLRFERPGFQRLLRDIEAGHINLVLTKDLSRLGRDYILTGYYTDLYFPRHAVRYIAPGDGIDSLAGADDAAPFRNILNDFYARDLSRKVKSAKRARAARGDFTGPQPPYGYRIRPDRQALEIDEAAAGTVRRIFALALDGLGAAGIARLLTAEKILTPAAYKTAQGDTRFARLFDGEPPEKAFRWAYTSVLSILRDEVYCGHMVGHKTEVVHYKTRKRAAVPTEERILVPSTHPPIVSEADFRRVQSLLQTRRAPRAAAENPFAGLLFCDECGHPLSMAVKRTGSDAQPFYRCMHHYRHPDECAHTHHIRQGDLLALLRGEWRGLREFLAGRTSALAARTGGADLSTQAAVTGEQTRIESRLAQLHRALKALYEDGALTAANRALLLGEYQQEQETLRQRLEGLSRPAAPAMSDEQLRARLDALFADPSPRLLRALVERIDVGHRQGGVQRIHIVYRFRLEDDPV